MRILAVAALRCGLLTLPFLAVSGCGGEGESKDVSTIASQGATVTLTWDGKPASTDVGYKIYWGTSSRNYHSGEDVGPHTSYRLSHLQHQTEYFIAVTAYNSDGESSFSNEVTVFLP